MMISHSPKKTAGTLLLQNSFSSLGETDNAQVLSEPDLTTIGIDKHVNLQNRKKRRLPSNGSPPASTHSVTLEQIGDLLDRKLAPSSSFMLSLREALKSDIHCMVSAELSTAIQEVKNDFTETTDFLSAEQNDCKTKITENDKKIKNLEADNSELQLEMRRLNSRLANMEKMSRDLNLELQAVPESRTENVLAIFEKLCQSLDTPININDIRACRRVAKMDTTSSRPRNILVTLSSSRVRDNIISAAYRFNKSNPDNLLNCTHAGLSEVGIRIYIKEHLSPEIKQLYAAARKFKNNNDYQYAWVRNGQVYIRKCEGAPHIHVKNMDILKNVI